MTYSKCPTCHGTGLVRPSEPQRGGHGERPKGPKPEPTPLPPLRRLQAVDEANRTPEPDEGLLIKAFPSWRHDERVLFVCLTIALIIIMSLYLRGV